MTDIHIYGIKNCDTMKKAMTWLNDQSITYTFHDYKKEAVTEEKIREWLKHVAVEDLVNRRGTTWRKLPEELRAALDDNLAVQLIQENPSLVKRPLLEANGTVHLGFKPDDYSALLTP